MKELKDFIGLYLGCEIMDYYNDKVGVMNGIITMNERVKVCVLHKSTWHLNIDEVKPILRPLSDMAGNELKLVSSKIYESIYNTKLEFIKAEISYVNGDYNAIGLIGTTIYHERIGLTIEVERGVEFSIDSTKMKVNQFEITGILLSIFIDLFNLIEAGLAIDKTKL